MERLWPQIFEHGEYPAMVGVGRWQFEFEKDAAYVLFDCSLGNHQLAGDCNIGPTFGHKGEHFALPRGQRVEHPCSTTSAYELGDYLRVEGRTTGGNSAERVNELGHVANTVLEQIADAGCTSGAVAPEELSQEAGFDVLGKDEYRQIWLTYSESQCGAQSLVGMARWQADVYEGQVWTVLGHGFDQRGSVAHGRRYVMASIGKDLDDACPDDGRVFGDHYSQGWPRAHGLTGNSTVSVVGPPSGLATVS